MLPTLLRKQCVLCRKPALLLGLWNLGRWQTEMLCDKTLMPTEFLVSSLVENMSHVLPLFDAEGIK